MVRKPTWTLIFSCKYIKEFQNVTRQLDSCSECFPQKLPETRGPHLLSFCSRKNCLKSGRLRANLSLKSSNWEAEDKFVSQVGVTPCQRLVEGLNTGLHTQLSPHYLTASEYWQSLASNFKFIQPIYQPTIMWQLSIKETSNPQRNLKTKIQFLKLTPSKK
jgi:hypothetical protein